MTTLYIDSKKVSALYIDGKKVKLGAAPAEPQYLTFECLEDGTNVTLTTYNSYGT